MILYVARHGETDWNAEKRWQGQTDTALNAAGRAQAEALADRLAGRSVARIHASDLSRARETAEIVAARLGVAEVVSDPDLRERGFGVFEGLTFEECMETCPEAFTRYRADRTLPEGAEPDTSLVPRVTRAIARALEGQGTALVVSHGAALRAFLAAAGARGASVRSDFGLPNGVPVALDLGQDLDIASLSLLEAVST
jgi:2,3-bisphosphoglycerate-dependent phosphoglycerate mutase